MNKQEETLIPRLRFPDFKGERKWQEKLLEQVYDFKITNSFSRDKLNYLKGSVKNIHYGDIHTKFSTLFDITNENVPFINPSQSLKKIKSENYCVEGDVIFADASEDLEDIGKSIEIVNLNNEKLLSGLHTLLIRQKEQILILGFGGYLFKSTKMRLQIQNEAQGAKVLGISVGRMSTIAVNYPSNQKEQQKIVSCLSSIDKLLNTQSQKLELLKSHKKALMQKMFPATGETVPKLRFPEFQNSAQWTAGTLDEICEVSSGGTPSRSNSKYWDGGDIPWVSTTLIDFNNIESANEFITEEGLRNSSAKLFSKDTILMAMYGQGKTRGKVAVLGIEAAINQACAALTLKKGFNTNFVFQNLANRYNEIREISNQGGQENLSGALIKNIPFSYPDITSKEQQRIANCLSSVDKTINLQTKKVEFLKSHKRGLMQQLFPSGGEA